MWFIENFESFTSIQFEYGKTGRIQIEYSRCISSQPESNTSEHCSIRGVGRSVFERIRARIFGFSRSECSVLARLQTTFLRFSLELLQVQVEFFVIASHFVILLEKKNYLVNLALCPAFSLVWCLRLIALSPWPLMSNENSRELFLRLSSIISLNYLLLYCLANNVSRWLFEQ